MNDLALYFQQNEIALQGLFDNLSKLRKAIDEGNGEQIAFHLDMLKGIYHILEGNNMNTKNLIQRENPAFKFLDLTN